MARRLFWLILVLLVFGLIILSSASVVQSQKQFDSSSYYWRHQLFWGILPGIVLMLTLWKFPYRHWRRLAFPLLLFSLVLLVLIFVPSWGLRVNGATSWLNVFGLSFQPAEVLKLALVVYLAAWLGGHGGRPHDWKLGLVPFVIIMGVIATLLLLQPDLGTLGIICIIAGGVYFIAGAPLKQVAIMTVGIVVLIGAMAVISPERLSRVTTIFHPMADARGSGWQLRQSLISIGSGGLWGKGLGQSTQTLYGFLPEPIGDSVFAVLVEELGFVGGAATVALFGLLALTLARIAREAPDIFGSLLASGMLVWIIGQAVVNMAAVTGIGPLTGIPLPFISYGGTSMVSMLAGLGIVLNIAERS